MRLRPRRDRGIEESRNRAAGCADCATQRSLLRSLLGVLLDQREHLVAGNVRALQQSNVRLSELLEVQSALGDESWRPSPELETIELAELLSLAARVSAENAINHMLAVRGLQFADLSSQMLGASVEAAHGPTMPSGDQEDAGDSSPRRGGISLRLLDTRS